MDKYLLEILKQVNTIIIPGLGALTITNNKTGEAMFLPYLKHDDGNLAKFIAEKEGIDLNDAKNIIARYVREIESKLNVGDTYDMFRFGSFSKNADGDVEFHSWHEDKQTKENEKLDEHSSKSSEEVSLVQDPSENLTKQVEITKEDIPEPKDSPIVREVTSPEPSLQPVDETTVTPQDKVEGSDPVKTFDEAVESTSAIEVNVTEETTVVHSPPVDNTPEPTLNDPKHESKVKQTQEKTTNTSSVISKPEEFTAKDESPNKKVIEAATAEVKQEKKPSTSATAESVTKKRGALFYAMVAGFVLVIGGSLTVALFYNSLEPYLPFVGKSEADTTIVETKKQEPVLEESDEENTTNESSSMPPENSNTMDEQSATTNQNTSNSAKPTSNRPPISNNGEGKYYLIVGSFKVKGNAERFSSNIKEASVIACNNAYYVVIGSYDSAAEAKAHLKDVSGNFNPWVFQIPC
jgi:hypothetical protein